MKKRLDLATLVQEDEQIWGAEDLLSSALQLATKSRIPALDKFRRAVRVLPPAALRRLDKQLSEARLAQRETERAARVRRPAAAKRERGGEGSGWSLRQEHVLCGKQGCTKEHGPYWYGYRTVEGRTKKHYFGKMRPTPAQITQALLGKRTHAGELEASLPKKQRKGTLAR